MKTLIWKEFRENIKWAPLPGLVILLVFLVDKPDEPLFDVTGAFFFCLTGVAFGAALGFVQIFFEGHGDKRSLLLHRPLSPSRIFLAKALAGVGLYLLALGIPFLCLETWLATPGNLPAPYHWQTSLPWLADILSGLVYYFAGMLVAQRDVRWYGSRSLALAAAFFGSYLVWALPEFWQALVAIGTMGLFMAVAAWGSFCAAGAYAPQPHLAKAALAVTMLLGLLIVDVKGKQLIGEWFDADLEYQYDVDRQSRLLSMVYKEGVGTISITELNGQAATDFEGRPLDGNTFQQIHATEALMETPLHWGYRNSSRFYVECVSSSMPGNERWYYEHAQGRLLGYDKYYHQLVGSFGPEGFTPSGQLPGERFQGELRYRNNRWMYNRAEYPAFPGGVYMVDYARRTIRKPFTPALGERVTFANRYRDDLDRQRTFVVVTTDKSFHFLTEEGAPLVSVPRVFDRAKHGYVQVGLFENPERYFVWYQPTLWLLEPEEYKTTPSYLLEYDATGREIARRTVPPPPYPAAPYTEAFFGLATPPAETAMLVGACQYLRSLERLKGCTQKSVLLDNLDSTKYYIPGIAPERATPRGLMPAYLVLILLAAVASALSCLLLARRYAFSRLRCVGWVLVGFFFGWIGLVLMLALQDWPARIACPKCRKLRVVSRDQCEHCGGVHASPAPDGTEIFEAATPVRHVALTANERGGEKRLLLNHLGGAQ